MNIVTINGASGAGKSTALAALASATHSAIMTGEEFRQTLPMIKRQKVLLAPHVYIDEGTQATLTQLGQLKRLYHDLRATVVIGDED